MSECSILLKLRVKSLSGEELLLAFIAFVWFSSLLMYNWKVNIPVPMWIIHIELKYFCGEEKLFLGRENREYR